VLLKKSLG